MDFDFDGMEDEDSPYAEVRASVSNIDDPEMPCLTLRMWVVGMVLLAIVAAANLFFNFRSPAPLISPNTIVLAAHPIGKLMAYALPITTYHLPRWLGGSEFSLNPGPWNIKEHACVYMMANIASGAPYAINAVVVAEFDYSRESLGFWFSIVLVLSTQITGYAFAGLCRHVLVQPASMIWPSDLVTCTVLNTLHAEEDEGRGGVSRYRFFIYVLMGSFFWFFLPGFLFTGLSIFSWVCWISPDNIPLNQVFGVSSGMGLSPLTFDWTQISWVSNPLMIPWWAAIQTFGGFTLFYWILLPALYYTNTWHLAHFPMFSSSPYDRFGHPYDVDRVLTADRSLNATAYDAYSPLYLPGAYSITYLIAFMLSSAVLVHAGLYYGPALVNAFKKIKIEKDDIHAKLMRSYPEVPTWWYASLFFLTFALTVVANEVWSTGLPVWGMILSILIPVIYMLPAGFIFATSGQVIALNLVAQVVPGALLPGKPIANMIFKGYTIQVLSETLSFVQDLKLGHYIKVPPRASFIVQLTATLFTSFLQVGVKQWMFAAVPDICQPHQASSLTCPHRSVFFTASAIWGLIGPNRQFGRSSIYYPEVYATIIGVVLPIPFWYWQRKRPNYWNTYIAVPVVLNAIQFIPPATGVNYSSWVLVCFVFQYLIRRRNFPWWSKFNYVTSAALDIGTLFSVLFIFFALQFPKGGTLELNWWGNDVWKRTADFTNPPLRTTPAEGF
ncbi:OPT oligopeptide transporter [Cytidiella melzeri]|nr:OPT oligopeptide transporter [Cytidiella melzeri]